MKPAEWKNLSDEEREKILAVLNEIHDGFMTVLKSMPSPLILISRY